MSEAKPHDGSAIKGYRTLTAGDIQVMNRLKDVSRHFLNLLDTAKETGADPHWVAMAKTEMQKACMFACRAMLNNNEARQLLRHYRRRLKSGFYNIMVFLYAVSQISTQLLHVWNTLDPEKS